MTDTNAALYQFWAGFNLPAYLSDAVPSNAQLDYITFEAVDGDAMTGTILTAFNWHRRTPNVNAERAGVLDEIARAIPVNGVRLALPSGGFLMLYRNSAEFQSYYEDPNDPNVVAGRTSYEVQFYHV